MQETKQYIQLYSVHVEKWLLIPWYITLNKNELERNGLCHLIDNKSWQILFENKIASNVRKVSNHKSHIYENFTCQ